MNIHLVLVQLLAVSLEMVVIYSFLNPLLGGKLNTERIKEKVFAGLVGCAVLIFLKFVPLPPVVALPIFVLAIFFASIPYYSDFKNRISIATTLTLIFLLAEISVGMIISLVSAQSIASDVNTNAITYLQVMFISKMVALIIVKSIIIYNNRQHNYSMSFGTWTSIMSIPLASIITIYGISAVAARSYDFTNYLYVLLVAISLIFANGGAFYLFERQLAIEEEKLKFLFLEKLQGEEKDFYDNLAKNQIEISRTAHDMKNSLSSILGALQDNKTEIAEEKIREMLSNTSNNLMTFTNEVAIDTMLNTKQRVMNENGIIFKPNCFMTGTHVFDEIDFCILLGNALDNAIEACLKLPEGEREITFKIKEDEEYLFCNIGNTMDGILPQNGEKTTKKEKRLHGFGLENMRAIIEKNGGNMTIRTSEDRYTVIIMFCYEASDK